MDNETSKLKEKERKRKEEEEEATELVKHSHVDGDIPKTPTSPELFY